MIYQNKEKTPTVCRQKESMKLEKLYKLTIQLNTGGRQVCMIHIHKKYQFVLELKS